MTTDGPTDDVPTFNAPGGPGDGADLFVTVAPLARPRREPLYFVVIVLLCTDIVFGLGLAVFAEKVIAFRPMAVMGLGLAVLGLGILAYFVLAGDKPKNTPGDKD